MAGEETSPEQPLDTPDRAFGDYGVYYTGEQWDQYDERLERDDDEEQGNDDAELQPMEKEPEAQAMISQANRTLLQARQAVKDARATRQPVPRSFAAAPARETEGRCFL